MYFFHFYAFSYGLQIKTIVLQSLNDSYLIIPIIDLLFSLINLIFVFIF